jgi:hypothetical protein
MDKPETEEDGIRAEALRRSRVLLQSLVRPGQTPASSPSPSSTPATTESTSDAKAPSPK